jgi:hypothetical protein
MFRITRIVLFALAAALLAGCVPFITPLPRDFTPQVAETPTPAVTATPAATPFPTPAEVAPEQTFTAVGDVAILEGEHGVSGKAIVMGLQTLIIQVFNYDGKASQADIRLVKGEDYDNPAAILVELEQRPYEDEIIFASIPASVGPDAADTIAVYNPETGEVYASSEFD